VTPRSLIIDPGDEVRCDFCNACYTDRDDTGGLMFESKAVCPKCIADGFEREVAELGETRFIVARCPETMSFRIWVLSMRDDWRRRMGLL
jgi:hypothetical protein